jgi:type I restriction enzyme S subunit
LPTAANKRCLRQKCNGGLIRPEVFGIYSIGDANSFRSGGKKHISQQKFNELARFNVLPDDVLVSRMGTVGKVCVVPKNSPEGIVSYHLIRVRVDREQCEPRFFAELLSVSEAAGIGLSRSGKGAVMSGINAAIVASFDIPVPPLPLQKEFAKRVAEIRELEAGQAASGRRLDDLFQSMLHRAFSGEL